MEKKLHYNINLIIDCIEKQSEEEKKSVEDAFEKVYCEKKFALQKEIRDKYRKKTEFELAKLTLEANQKASELEAEHKAALSKKRDMVAKEVFSLAGEKIASFVESDGYEKLLCRSAKEMSDLYDGNAVVYIRECDLKYKDAIEKSFGRPCTFEARDDIKFGGIMVFFSECAVIADDTLDTRLEKSKRDFINNSSLGSEINLAGKDGALGDGK